MVKCCVAGCKIRSTKEVTYFKFPVSRTLRRKWEAAIKASGRKASGAAVCSLHFRPADYTEVRGKVRLKATVVPSIFEIKNNSFTNDIPIDQEIKNKSSISPEREESPVKDTDLESKESDLNDSTLESHDSPISHASLDTCPDKSNTTNKDVTPERESSQHKEKDSNEDENAQKEKSIENNPCNDDMPKTNGVTEEDSKIKEKDPPKDKIDPEKDTKDNSVEKDSYNIEVNTDVNTSEKSDNNSDSKSVTDKENANIKEKDDLGKQIVELIKKNAAESIDENQDIEELLTDYRIEQNNIHRVDEEILTLEIEPEDQSGVYQGDLPHKADPVFIELAVDKESANDCLMVLESVQVEIDPSTLLENQDFEVASDDLDGDDDDDDDVKEVKESIAPKEPISLLTSSDEDDVIIEEPHIDTVEVSDETDEDDKPLVQLIKKKKKKKVKRKRSNSEDKISQVLWGMYEYYCIECHFRTNSKSEYNQHKLEHTKVLLMCQLCGYMTSSESQLLKHEKQHKDFKRYQCHLCNYKAKHNMSLVYHMRSHKNEKSYNCQRCGYLTRSATELVKHVVLCKGLDGKKHCCDKCDYRTKKPSDLRRHKASKHKESDSSDEYVP